MVKIKELLKNHGIEAFVFVGGLAVGVLGVIEKVNKEACAGFGLMALALLVAAINEISLRDHEKIVKRKHKEDEILRKKGHL